MSHQPERNEKDCLNCGTLVHGRFCHNCGQENIVPHQNFWSLTRHFIYDILHFDGKFFDTVKYLFTRPGYVPKMYVQGKRMRFLDPIRMYLFTSAVFFLVFFAQTESADHNLNEPVTQEDRLEMVRDFREQVKEDPEDSAALASLGKLLDTSRTVTYGEIESGGPTWRLIGGNYTSRREYDSVQQSLPAGKKDGWLRRKMALKDIQLREKYRGSERVADAAAVNAFLHQFPYLLFVSLPFFALILKLLYVRRKKFFYNDHAVFTLFHYILSFLLILLFLLVDILHDWWTVKPLEWLSAAIIISWLLYLYFEMKNFYGQGYLKTFIKFVFLNFLGFLLLLILFAVFLIISFINL